VHGRMTYDTRDTTRRRLINGNTGGLGGAGKAWATLFLSLACRASRTRCKQTHTPSLFASAEPKSSKVRVPWLSVGLDPAWKSTFTCVVCMCVCVCVCCVCQSVCIRGKLHNRCSRSCQEGVGGRDQDARRLTLGMCRWCVITST
jgi:hypothetical protein